MATVGFINFSVQIMAYCQFQVSRISSSVHWPYDLLVNTLLCFSSANDLQLEITCSVKVRGG